MGLYIVYIFNSQLLRNAQLIHCPMGDAAVIFKSMIFNTGDMVLIQVVILA